MPTDTECAWAAGIVDGEGCITITMQQGGKGGRINPSYRLYLKVTMGHKETIERLQYLFDAGTVVEQRSNKGHNAAWSWIVATRQAGDVLEQIYQYSVTKREEMDLAFEYLAIPATPRGGSGGSRSVPPEVLAEKQRLFEALRDIKPSARFRAAKREMNDNA